MKAEKLNRFLLVLAVLWLAAAVWFFILHFRGEGVIPLALPVLFLVVSAVFVLFYFHIRKLLKQLRSETKDQK